MRGRINTFQNQTDGLKAVRDYIADYKKYLPYMNQLDIAKANNELTELRQRHSKQVADAAIASLYKAAERVQSANRTLSYHRQKEQSGWDASVLAPEMNVIKMRLDAALTSVDAYEQVKTLWDEAEKSNDRYKIRAFAECAPFAVTRAKDIDEKINMHGLVTISRIALDKLRYTDEIKSAENSAKEAFAEFQTEWNNTREIAQDMGESDPDHIYATGLYGDAFQRLKKVSDDNGIPNVLIMPERGAGSPLWTA